MKLLFILFATSVPLVMAGENQISEAFKNGDVSSLAQYLGQSVEISIDKKNEFYIKTEAIKKLSSFFQDARPQSFKVIHSCKSKGTSNYTIGQLNTERGAFRTYIYFQEKAGNPLIREIRLERNL